MVYDILFLFMLIVEFGFVNSLCDSRVSFPRWELATQEHCCQLGLGNRLFFVSFFSFFSSSSFLLLYFKEIFCSSVRVGQNFLSVGRIEFSTQFSTAMRKLSKSLCARQEANGYNMHLVLFRGTLHFR